MQEINNISLFFIKWKAKVISVMMVFLVTQIHFRYFISNIYLNLISEIQSTWQMVIISNKWLGDIINYPLNLKFNQ